jgi:hypothetical protein
VFGGRTAGEGGVNHTVEHHGPDVAGVLLVVALAEVGAVGEAAVIELAPAERGPDAVKVMDVSAVPTYSSRAFEVSAAQYRSNPFSPATLADTWATVTGSGSKASRQRTRADAPAQTTGSLQRHAGRS